MMDTEATEVKSAKDYGIEWMGAVRPTMLD